jgi:hypothetical protein
VASTFNRPAYSLRGSCVYRIRQIITERRAGSLRVAFSHLLLQVNSPHFSMREALPGNYIGRALLWRAFLLRGACGPRARARRARARRARAKIHILVCDVFNLAILDH